MMSRLNRAAQVVASGALGLVILAGIPYACIRYVGWPLPTSIPDRTTLYEWIEQPITPGRSWAALSIVGWILWAGMVYVLVGEIAVRLGGFRRLPRLRVASPLQGLAAGMVGATAVTAPVTAHTASAAPAPASLAQPDIDSDTATAPLGLAGASVTTDAELTYVVEHGDWLSAIAARFLGNPDAYPVLIELNPQLVERGPNHIEPGWGIRLPADASDRGIRLHAAGTFIPAPVADATPAPPPAATAQPPSIPTDPALPTESGPEPADEASSILDDGEPDVVIGQHGHGAMAGAGLVAAMLLALLTAERRRQRGYLLPGDDPPLPRDSRAERELRVAQLPADVQRLDAALRNLSRGLATRDTLPDIVGVRLVGRDVQVLLAQPDDNPPAPWLDEGTQWALPGYIDLEESTQPPVLLPFLVTVGSRAGRHLHLDLHRLGTLSITGHPYRARDLLRHLVCELACAPWAQEATVVLAGLGDEGEALVDIQPTRLQTVATTAQAITAVRAELHRRGEPTAANPPLVLAVANPTAETRAELVTLHRDLAVAGQRGVAVIVCTGDSQPVASSTLAIADDGAVRVDVPGLRLTTDAATVPIDMLEPLAQVLRTARLTQTTDPTTPGPSPTRGEEPDTQDPATNVLALFDADALPPAAPASAEPPRPDTINRAAADADADQDPALDADIAAWFDVDPARPMVGILGPIRVWMPGEITDSKHRLYTEMLLYLLTRPDRACDRAQMENALWYGHPAGDGTVRAAMARLRRWLGSRPGSGEWISEGNLPHGRYTAADGILLDWHLLLRLRDRGDRRGDTGAADYRTALQLVRGPGMQDRRDYGRYRRPYTWIDGSEINPVHILAAITDIAHRLATYSLDVGDTDTARWAVQQGWLADPDRGYDDLWIDYLRAEHSDGRTAALHSLIEQLREDRGAEVLEDLQPRTYKAIHELLRDNT